jgi:hydrogenase expression/formation protein HypE
MNEILLAHGGGGRLTEQLIAEVFLPALGNEVLREMEDSARLEAPPPGHRLALTTDSYVVQPLFFPGGDIGKLAVCGTVNDLAMVGSQPKQLTFGLIIEEGFPISWLREIVASAASAAREAGVQIVAGDTKVVPRDSCDGVFINTSGVGWIPKDRDVAVQNIRPGDSVIISGTIGDHGTAVMACRENLGLSSDLASDVAPLSSLVEALFDAGVPVHALRDPTRGGVAQALGEMAVRSGVHISLDEADLPIHHEVTAVCDLLGLDVLQVANEGKLLAFVPEDASDRAIEALSSHRLGARAKVIGKTKKGEGLVELRTTVGGRRIVERPTGELLPRIC